MGRHTQAQRESRVTPWLEISGLRVGEETISPEEVFLLIFLSFFLSMCCFFLFCLILFTFYLDLFLTLCASSFSSSFSLLSSWIFFHFSFPYPFHFYYYYFNIIAFPFLNF